MRAMSKSSWTLTGLEQQPGLKEACSSVWPPSQYRNFFRLCSLNIPWCIYVPFLHILWGVTRKKRSSPPSPLPFTLSRKMRLPLSLLFSRLDNPSLLSLFSNDMLFYQYSPVFPWFPNWQGSWSDKLSGRNIFFSHALMSKCDWPGLVPFTASFITFW